MNKRDNVIKLLNGEEYEKIPSGFWIHFNEKINQGTIEDKAQAHLEFAKNCDLSVVKIMNENEFRRSEKVQSSSDWSQIPLWSENDRLFSEQLEISQRTLELLDGEYYSLGTVHGLVASLSHSSGLKYSSSLELLREHAKQNKTAVLEAIKNTTENVIHMLNTIEKSGVDAIYYAALGGEKDRLTSEFYEEFIAPYDKMILDEIKKKPIFLHICKQNIDFNRFKDYPATVVNWAIHETDLSLEEGAALFDNKIILGGLDDRSGVLVEGNKEEIKKEINNISSRMKGQRFILGADCTLPTEIDYQRIQLAAQYVRDLK